MKYKCTDCGQEYDIKPDFCDCGNNLFDEIPDGKPVADEKAEEKFEDLKNIYPQAEFKPEYPPKRIVDIPSLLIFILCIILSICSWIFIGRDTKNLAQNSVNESIQTDVKEIPSIDKLWKEKTPSTPTVVPQPVPEPVAVKAIEQKAENKDINKTVKKAETPKKTVQTASKPTQATSQAKSTTQQQKNNQQPQPTMTEQEKQAIIQKLTTKKSQSNQSKQPKAETPKTNTNQTAVEPKQEQVTTEVKPETKPEVKAPDPAQLKKEYDAYKIALRNKLGKSINFAAVIGDGKCAVTFKLDQTGNLINRKFSVQSKNNSLNDVVYAAMMQNATFKEPPEGYKGETLTLTVTMYGGNFEVTLK